MLLLLVRGGPAAPPPTVATGSVASSTAAPPAPPAAEKPLLVASAPKPQGPAPRPAARPAPEKRPRAAAAEDEDDDDTAAALKLRPELRDKLLRTNRNVEDGHRLLKENHLGLAEAAYLKALAIMPDYPRAMAGLARVHLARKDAAEALRWAKRLISAQPKRGNNQLLLGDAWALRGNLTLARDAWQRSALYGNATARKRLAQR